MLPLLIRPEEVIFFYYILARLIGLFLLSPLFSRQLFPLGTRILLTIFMSVIFFMVFYSSYQSPIEIQESKGWLYIGVNSGKEILVGYVLGFCFSLIVEAVLLAGALIDSMMDVTATSILDSAAQTTQAFLGPLLIVAIALIGLSMDFHHYFIKAIHNSFLTIPLGNYHLSPRFMPQMAIQSGFIFVYALKFALITFIVLTFISFTMGFIVRIFPEFNPILTFAPLRIYVSYFALILTLGAISPLIHHSFLEVENLSKSLIQLIGGH